MSKKRNPPLSSLKWFYLHLKFKIITPDMPLIKTYVDQLPELIMILQDLKL